MSAIALDTLIAVLGLAALALLIRHRDVLRQAWSTRTADEFRGLSIFKASVLFTVAVIVVAAISVSLIGVYGIPVTLVAALIGLRLLAWITRAADRG